MQTVFYGAIEHHFSLFDTSRLWVKGCLCFLYSEKDERGPDEELRLQFEAVTRIPTEDKQAIRTLLEEMIVKNRAKHMLEGIGG